MAWERRLRASVSAAALCCILPCTAMAALVPGETQPVVTTPVKLKAPATLPWLVNVPPKHMLNVYMPAQAVLKKHIEEPASHIVVLQPPRHQQTETQQAAEVTPPVKTAEVVLHPPVNAALPWLTEQQVALKPPSVQKTITSPFDVVAEADEKDETTETVPKAAEVAQEIKPDATLVLQKPAEQQAEQQAEPQKVAELETVEVKTYRVAEDHTVWRDEKEENYQQVQQAENVVLTPPADIASVAENPPLTKTTLERIEIAVEQRFETADGQPLTVLSPAAGGEPTQLMPPKEAPPHAMRVAEPVPKLTPPNVAPVATQTITPAPIVGAQETVPTSAAAELPPEKIIPTPLPPAHTLDKEVPLSEESKDILDRLPSELRSSGAKESVTIHRDRNGAQPGKEDVKKHDAYGMKIAVKRPKVDVFRTLESAYNSLIAGDQQYAITLYKEVLDVDHENTTALFGLATTYHRAGQPKLARPLYAQLLEIDPQNVEGLNNFLVLIADESPRAALVELEKLQHSHPSFSPVPAQMALICEKQGEYAKAAAHMAHALSITPENIKYQYDMAIIYDKMGDWEEAAKWYQGLITAHERGEKIPGKAQEIQQRLTFIRSNTSSH